MSDLTWTEMPEVNPEQPDELVLDFSGEIHRIAPADTFVIGRGGDLDIDDNPYLHRRFLVFAFSEKLWWIANEGSRLSATLTDGEGLVQSRLAPGARIPLVFPRVILTFSAGPTTYEINLVTSGEDHFSGIDGVRQSSGQTTIGVTPMTRSQLLLVLALSEPVLWPLTKFNRKLDNVCEKLDRVGVRGLRGGRVAGAASNRRTALVEHAVSTLMVTAEDLYMLDEERVANQADAGQEPARSVSTAPVAQSSPAASRH